MARSCLSHVFKEIISTSFLIITSLMFSNSVDAAINIVAAENVYGSVAQQLGGNYVTVTSILNNPNQDPHLFSASPSGAKAVANADIVVYNGAAYDNWMNKLLSVQKQTNKQQIINIAQLLNTPEGANPHLWYDPQTMPVYARHLVQLLQQQDPAHQAYYALQLNKFMRNYQSLFYQVAQLHKKYQGVAVIATEPLFGYMAQAIGFKMQDVDFQWSIMNSVEPSPSQLRQFQDDLNQHKVRVLFYNKQVTNPLTQRLELMAQKNNIPIVGITELQPANTTYLQWMLDELVATEQALNHEP